LANVIPKLNTLPFERKPRTFNSNVYLHSFTGAVLCSLGKVAGRVVGWESNRKRTRLDGDAGKTLVKWMMDAGTGVKMELEALILGELMLNAGVIIPLSRKVEFSASSKDYYALAVRLLAVASPKLWLTGAIVLRSPAGELRDVHPIGRSQD